MTVRDPAKAPSASGRLTRWNPGTDGESPDGRQHARGPAGVAGTVALAHPRVPRGPLGPEEMNADVHRNRGGARRGRRGRQACRGGHRNGARARGSPPTPAWVTPSRSTGSASPSPRRPAPPSPPTSWPRPCAARRSAPWPPARPVNLERPLRLGGRLGGHLVQGHVDGVAVIVSRSPAEHWDVVRITVPPGLARYIVEKGSVAVDGVSLTVSAVGGGGPAVSRPGSRSASFPPRWRGPRSAWPSRAAASTWRLT